MNKLQFLCLLALEDMTLKELNKKYFEDGGIGYTKRVIAGKACPVEFMVEMIAKRFEEKYLKAYKAYDEYEKSFKGW